jgi:hypothetical protein
LVFREQVVVGYWLSEIEFNVICSWKSCWMDDHFPRMPVLHPHSAQDAHNLQVRP